MKRASRTRNRVLRIGTAVAVAVALVMTTAPAATAVTGANGQRLSDMGGLGTAGIHVADNPAVAFNSNDSEYLVVWEGTENDSAVEQTRIYGQRVDAGTGAEIGSNDFLIAAAPGDAHQARDAFAPAVAYNSSDNEYLVIFVGQPNAAGTESEVYGQRVSATGTLSGATFQISDCGVPGDTSADVGATFGYPLDLAYNATDNQYLAVWRCDDVGDNGIINGEFEIIGQIVNADGSLVLVDDVQISQVGGANGANTQYDAESPAVAWNSTNNEYLVTWGADNATLGDDDRDGDREIFGQRLSSAGAQLGTNDFQISTTSHGGPDSAVSDVVHNPDLNEYLVVWSGDINTDNEMDIFGQFIDGVSGVLSGGHIDIGQNGTATDPANEPEVVYNSLEEEYVVVWQAAQAAGENEVFGQRISAAGIEQVPDDFRISDLGPEGNASYDANESTGLAYASSPLNSYYVVWGGQDDQDGQVLGENEIFGQAIGLGPTAALTGDETLGEGETGNYDASGSTWSLDAIVSYEWDWDYDGTTFFPSGDTGVTQTHAWDDDGTYTVAVRVTDGDGSTDIATLVVTVNDLGLTAALTGDETLVEGQTGSYDASGSTSSPDLIVSYEWDWDYDGTTFFPSGDTGVTQTHAWNDDGTHTAAVRVTDDDGSTDIATLVVTVNDLGPPTAPVVDVTPDAPVTGDDLLCSITTASTDPDDDDITYSYAWYMNAVHQPDFDGEITVPAVNTTKDETWRCVVTPYDGTNYGATGEDEVTIDNTPPSVDSVAIAPDPAYTDDDLTATLSGWSDPDGDPEGYQWQWQKYDGASWQDIPGATTDTLDSSNCVKDDQIKIICTPFDGTDTGGPVEGTITISNSPPTAPVVDVTPDAPVTGDDLLCSITTASTDPDDDDITYSYAWYMNAVHQPDFDGEITVPAVNTTKDETWRCVVTPYDGTNYGATGEDEVTIDNTPPSVDSVAIAPDPAYTDDDLTATLSGWSDPDGDPEGYQWQWQKYDGASWQDIPGATTDTLDSSNCVKDDQIKIICTPFDGTDTGGPVEGTITISNSPPTAPVVDVTPDAPVTGDDLLCSITTASTDPDDDDITYSYAWYMNAVHQPDFDGEITVPAVNTTKDETWRCVVTPYDGTNYGATGEDEVTIDNTPPSVDSVAIAPDPAYTDDDLTATLSGWSDPDGDPEGYQWQWQKYDGASWQDIPGATTDTLDSSNCVKDDQIKIICTPFDGTDTGGPVEGTITISNSPPTAPVVDVTPDAPVTGDDLLCSITTASTDPDDDDITYSYAWYMNAVHQPDFDGEITVPAVNTTKDETWRCVVTPYDGTNYGATGEDEVTIDNTPPSVDSVAIAPDPAYTDDDLTATLSGWSDPDGDPEGYQWQWQKYDGASWQDIPGATTNTLDSSNCIKDDQIKIICTPFDGTDTGGPVEGTITISNSPPTAPVVDVTPDAPVTGDDLLCSITTASTDPDDDDITYSYAWYMNAVHQPDFDGETTVPAVNTTKDETWRCVVTPYDGTNYGATGEDEVTIDNTPPSVDSVAIAPDPAYTDGDLTATPSGWSDPDGDPEGYQWQWQKYDGASWQDIPGATTDTLDSSNCVKDDQIKIICTPFDGTDTGGPVEGTITISNSPPTAPVVDVTPDAPVTGDDLLCSITTASTDPDGDLITYSYAWYKDDVLQPGLTTDAVPAASTAEGETWKCVVTPNDGTDSGATGEDQATTAYVPLPPPPPELPIDENGVFTETYSIESDDGKVEFTVNEGTTGLTAEGEPLSEITIAEMADPPDPPEGANVIGLAYDLGPDGATFEHPDPPPATLIFHYDPAAVPEGVDEIDLVIAVWHADAGEWVELICTVDPINHIITAELYGFSAFTIMSFPPAVTTDGASIVGTNSARLSGSLADIGTASSVDVSFEWGETQGGPYPNETTPQSMSSTGDLDFNLTGLEPGTTYYFRAKAVGAGTVYGVEMNLVLPAVPPSVTTNDARDITEDSVTLHASLDDLGTATLARVSFEWGENQGGPYPNQTKSEIAYTTRAFSFTLVNLEPDKTYYYRAVVVSISTVYGDEKSFGTLSPPPEVKPVELAPAAFSLSNLTISPERIIAGESITISIRVSNTGGQEGTHTVTLYVDGVMEEANAVTLAGGGSQILTFTASRDTAGSYEATLDGQEGSFEVLPPPVAVNWPLIGGVIGAIAVILTALFLVTRRRRALAG